MDLNGNYCKSYESHWGFPKRRGDISTIAVVRAMVGIVNFASFVRELLVESSLSLYIYIFKLRDFLKGEHALQSCGVGAQWKQARRRK